MIKRPCECGCKFEEHEKYDSFSMYCTSCPTDGISCCYNYRPCGNLAYLEYLYAETH
jgi:hypothetical protein